jgi:hypothetical protein
LGRPRRQRRWSGRPKAAPTASPKLWCAVQASRGSRKRRFAEAPANDAAEQAVCDALLIEAAFADFAHDIPKAQHLVRRFFTEAELHAWGTRRQAILAATVDGLFSQSVAVQCAEKLAEWIPDYHEYGRQGAILAMQKWTRRCARRAYRS